MILVQSENNGASGNKTVHHIPSRFFFKDFIYLFMRDTERESETQAEGGAGSMQGVGPTLYSHLELLLDLVGGHQTSLR